MRSYLVNFFIQLMAHIVGGEADTRRATTLVGGGPRDFFIYSIDLEHSLR